MIFLQKIKRFENENVKFIVNKERVGKANAVNSTVKLVLRQSAAFLRFRCSNKRRPRFFEKNHHGNYKRLILLT